MVVQEESDLSLDAIDDISAGALPPAVPESMPPPSPSSNNNELSSSLTQQTPKVIAHLPIVEDVVELSPVLIGDYIVLQDLNSEDPGFMTGDPAFERCGVQKIPVNRRTALEYDNYVFQVYPALLYRSRSELSQKQSNRPRSSSLRRSISINSSTAASNGPTHEEKLLMERVEHEDRLNDIVIDEVKRGVRREALRYGQDIQLLHVKSGLFIRCHHTAALKDASCRRVSLRIGSASSHFKVMPCFKAQTEGSVVFSTHNIKLSSAKLNGSMFLHTSTEVYEDVFDPTSKTLPRCLRTPQIMELNASSSFTTFVIRIARSFKGDSSDSMKTAFNPFRLYHSQSESFVVASSNTDKNASGEQRKTTFKTSEGSDNELSLPAHVPFLRELDYLSTSEDPDPSDPRNHLSKAVWSFEPLSRSSCSLVGWGELVRIRHLPSGRYLCVDTTAPFHSLPPSENWYRTYLVVDTTDDPILREDKANYCSHEAATFRVECEGTLLGTHIPKNVSNGRIEFKIDIRGASLHLFLHNAEVPKPCMGDDSSQSKDRSRLLVFSTQRSAQDAMKIMPVNDEEAAMTFKALSFIPFIRAYSERLANPLFKIPTHDNLQDIMNALIKIIVFQFKATSIEVKGFDWIKQANSMLPSAFCQLFEGEPNSLAQRISKDTGLMDAVFEMSLAPYQRFEKPFDGKDEEVMLGCAGIQKLVHVALQRMFHLNTASQLYFRRQCKLTRPILKNDQLQQSSWMDLIKLQLEDPLGSAVTLSKLFSANGTLLRAYATQSMVKDFARMITELGPQPRLVNFFESICAVGEMPVKANQEMVLRLTWRVPEERAKLYVEVIAADMKTPKPFGKVARLPGGDLVKKETLGSLLSKKQPPPDYLGKNEAMKGYKPVFVHWSGSDNWVKRSEKVKDSLFWSPSKMTESLNVHTMDGKSLVRIEEFAWVLEPARLCSAITGQNWDEKNLEEDKDFEEKYRRQKQLAEYFVAQIKMLSKLCFGRSYNCISMLQLSFPYITLISIVENEYLPCLLRAVMLDLLRTIYVDRFPQMLNCARPSIPEVLWVYDNAGISEEDNLATPVIQPIDLKSKFAFPSFNISKTHKFYGDKDPLFGFPDENKYYLLTKALRKIMVSFGKGRIDHSNRNMNTLASHTVKAFSDLLSFGFMSSYERMQPMVKSLVLLLDGRRDVERVTFADSGEQSFDEPFHPPELRYELTTFSVSVTAVKREALDVLIAVSDFRCQFRLGKLLQIFKEHTEDKTKLTELQNFQKFMSPYDGKPYDGPLVTQLFNEFEGLFNTGDGKMLDFEEMSGEPLMTILLDCLMYKDDELHSKALELLERTYTQRKRLLKAVEDVILLDRAPHYPKLNSDINYFVLLLRSSEVWAVSSAISGSFDKQKEKDFNEMCEAIDTYLYEERDDTTITTRKDKMENLTKNSSSMLKMKFPSSKAVELASFTKKKKPTTSDKKSPSSSFNFGREITPKAAALDVLRQGAPIKEHQDMLRAMNLQFALSMALRIDYNLAFKGSLCEPEEKIESRNIHISVLRKVVLLLTDFVRNNTKNQDLIFKDALPYLEQHLGDLELPPIPEDFPKDEKTRKLLVTQPGLNTEVVIIECIRGNARLCEELPSSLFNAFGSLLDRESDCSTSPLVDFFNIAITPEDSSVALFRNQESTLDQLITSKHKNALSCVYGCFNLHNKKPPAQPQVIIDLLSKCIMNDNSLAASQLQAVGVTVEATFQILVSKMGNFQRVSTNISDTKSPLIPPSPTNRMLARMGGRETQSKRWERETNLLHDDHFLSVVLFLSNQLTSLVVDPRMYQKPEMWLVVCDGVGALISGFASNLYKIHGGFQEKQDLIKEIGIIVPCIKTVHYFIRGASQAGSDEYMLKFDDGIRGDPSTHPTSILSSVKNILKFLDTDDTEEKKNFPPELTTHVEENIVLAARSLQFLLIPESQNEATSVNITRNKAETVKEKTSTRRSMSIPFDAITKSSAASSTPAVKYPPAKLLSFFVEALTSNSKIVNKLQMRKFEFLDVLEKAAVATSPKRQLKKENFSLGAVPSNFLKDGFVDTVQAKMDFGNDTQQNNGAQYGVVIEWSMIVTRLVDFAKAHNFDRDESALIRVHDVLRDHILKARSDKSTSEIKDAADMDYNSIQQYRKVQTKLDEAGVTEMALTAIATHVPGARDAAAVSAIKLLKELLYTGNRQVQNTVLSFIEHVDKDARFLKHIRSRLLESTHYIKERNDQVRSHYEPMMREHQLEYAEAEQTLQLMIQLTEGHNLATQDILRHQPSQPTDVDLIKTVLDLLHLQAGEPRLLQRMGQHSIDLLVSNMDLVVEALQGPCDGNQRSLVGNEQYILTLKNIIQSEFDPARNEPHVVMKVKCRAMLIFAACLEGRKDREVHDALVSHVDPSMLQQFALDTTEFIRNSELGDLEWSKNMDKRKKIIDEALLGLVALANVRTELNLISSFAIESAQVEIKKSRAAAEKMLRDSVASVEVMWNGRVEFVSFPLPKTTAYLSDSAKTEFLDTVELATHEKRMKQLIKAKANLSAEMHQVYSLAKHSPLYRFMHKHFSSIKLIQYSLVLLLNLNVIMTSYGDDKESQNGAKKDLGYTSPYRAAFEGDMKKEYRTSLALTYILGVPNFLGYFFIMAYMGITSVPIVIRLIDSNAEDKRIEAENGQEVVWRNNKAFTWWGVVLLFNILFIIIHLAAYPHDPQPLLYIILIFGINLPWLLGCIRNHIVVANTSQTRLFCIIYDSLVTKPFFRNQIIMVFFSLNGFRFSYYFTLMLLDVVNISSTVQNLVKSITKPGPQLGIVAYLFVILVIIFASFGLEYFEPYFVYDQDYDDDADDIEGPNPYGCHSVVACFWLILYKGVPGGRMDEVLDVITNRETLYLGRVFFDLLFFVVVGVFLFNIITGLIVDMFISIREEAASRADQLNNECFVCGFTRTAYDDLGIITASFDTHMSRHHHIWNYLYFIQYIEEKDQTDFSGVESFVFNRIQAKSQDWIPSRTSFATQNHYIETAAALEDASAKKKDMDIKLAETLQAIEKKINDITSEVDRKVGERLAVEMESFQKHMEDFVKKVSTSGALGTHI